MQRLIKCSLLSLCLAVVALGAPITVAADGLPPASTAGLNAAPAVEAEAPAGEAAEAVQAVEAEVSVEASCAGATPESTPAFGTPVFLGDECVGYCRANYECDAYCGVGNGGCDLNPANPCYRQCICLL